MHAVPDHFAQHMARDRDGTERGDHGAVVSESADLLYHWLVVLALAGVPLADVMDELERRTARSGIAEKAARAGPAEGR